MTDDHADRMHAHFESWAADYDDDVGEIAARGGYPFAGYGAVIDAVADAAIGAAGPAATGRPRVLDLGTGTGEVAARLLARGADVVGADFSAAMLARAADRLAGGTLVECDLRAAWPSALDGPFDAVTSAYVLHEFDDEVKLEIVARAIARAPGGVVAIGDVAFDDAAARAAAARAYANAWDASEHYWAADEAIVGLRSRGLEARWTRVSSCAGVIVVRAAAR